MRLCFSKVICDYSLRSFLFLDFIYLLLERGEGREKKEKHQCVVVSYTAPNGDLAHNPDMCPDWNQIGDLLARRSALNPLSHTSQGHFFFFLRFLLIYF